MTERLSSLGSRWKSGLRSVLRLMVFVCLTLLCGMLSSNARAQFSGPAPQPSAALNMPPVVTTDPAILYPASRDLSLDVGDLIRINIFGYGEYSPTVRVSLDGSIQIPLGGVLQVAGLTLPQVRDAVAKRLQDAGMYRDPQVTIQLMESPNQVITVTGELHAVIVTNGSSKRLYEVLAGAGEFPVTASHTVTIQRRGQEQPIVVDLGSDPSHSAHADIPVFPHDTIIVSRVGVVYLLGAFKTQGAIPLQQNTPLTLMQATALGNGDLFEGKYDDLRIVRTVGLERKVLKVNISKVMQGQEPDPVLQPDDIIFLPTSALKGALKNGGVGTLLGVISLLVFTLQSLN